MRRKDREITDLNKICEVMEKCICLHLGLNDNKKNILYRLIFGVFLRMANIQFISMKHRRDER